MTYNTNPAKKSWRETVDALWTLFERWRVRGGWVVESPAERLPSIQRNRERIPWDMRTDLAPEQRAATITFTPPPLDGKPRPERSLTVSRFPCAADNLRALYLGLDAIRLNEGRGLADVAAAFYLALPAASSSSPWDVLGVREGASSEEITSAYRAAAKRAHPDAGGDPAEWARIDAAYRELRP